MKHEAIPSLSSDLNTPKPWLSHNILVPGQTIALSSLASVRSSGQLHNTAKSAVRALEVVELLGVNARPLRAFEIATEIGLSPSSADQLLKTLVEGGFLIFDTVTKCYHVSPRLSKIGGSLTDHQFPDTRLERMTEALHREIGHVISILCSQGTFMQGVLRWPSCAKEGLRVPLLGSSSGTAWLAAQPDDVISSIIMRCRRELEDVKRDTTRIFEAIRRVRSDGYAIGGLTIADGMCGIGVALPPARNGTVLVLSVTAPFAELQVRKNDLYEVIRDQISRFLVLHSEATAAGSG